MEFQIISWRREPELFDSGEFQHLPSKQDFIEGHWKREKSFEFWVEVKRPILSQEDVTVCNLGPRNRWNCERQDGFSAYDNFWGTIIIFLGFRF